MDTPSVLLAAVLSLFLILTPRKYFLFPFIAAACLVPMSQRVEFLSLDFTILRILILVAVVRMMIRGETREIQWNYFDKLMLSWVVVGSLVFVLQYGSSAAVINRLGVIYDSLGMYWLLRQVVRNWEDVFQAIRLFAFFAIITAPLIALEKIQESSLFAFFGDTGGEYHRGRFRAAGPFPHFIIMGCFWASLLPLFYASLKAGVGKTLFFVAIFAALSNVYFSASSTPFILVIAILFFWYIYNYRMHGKIIFWGASAALVLLHLVMKAPVWHLMSRVAFFEGSTGWHRYFLFDNFIKNMSEWFWLGTQYTAHWGHMQTDLTNQFVLEGVRGGMITLLLFVLLIYHSVKISGKLSLVSGSPEIRWVGWGICVAMLGHFVAFWGVSYFGQINMLLYINLALVGFALETIRKEAPSAAQIVKSTHYNHKKHRREVTATS